MERLCCCAGPNPFLPFPAPNHYLGCCLSATGGDEKKQMVNGLIFQNKVNLENKWQKGKWSCLGIQELGGCDGQGRKVQRALR